MLFQLDSGRRQLAADQRTKPTFCLGTWGKRSWPSNATSDWRSGCGSNGIRTTVTWTTATQTSAIQENCNPDNFHQGQSPPRTTSTRTTTTLTSAIQENCNPDNCHLGQLPPRTIATQDNCHPDNYHQYNCQLRQLTPGQLSPHGCRGAETHSHTFLIFSFVVQWKWIGRHQSKLIQQLACVVVESR